MATTEERLAALEAKLAALTATTPTEYYTHQYSGEEIDAAVGRALTGGALDTSVTNVSNQLGTFVRPNLLDNWYFGRTVNQRGVSSGTEWGGNKYGLDRWVAFSVGVYWDSNGYIVFPPRLENNLIYQRLKKSKFIVGSKITLSLLTDDGNLFFKTVTYTGNTIYGVLSGTIFGNTTIVVTDDYVEIRIWYTENNASEGHLAAAKLELCSQQTLAHQEGDRWVLNEIPDYGEQLRRCLRYDYILGNASQNCPIGIGTAYSNDGVMCVIQLPEYMRTNPAVTLSGGVQIRFSATQILTATSVLNYGFSGDKVQLYFPGLSGLTPGQSCDLYTQIGSRLEFNSNL